jgi:hypothetical protein
MRLIKAFGAGLLSAIVLAVLGGHVWAQIVAWRWRGTRAATMGLGPVTTEEVGRVMLLLALVGFALGFAFVMRLSRPAVTSQRPQ